MTFDPAHTSTLAELARVQRERDELRLAGAALLDSLGGHIQRTYPEATLLAALIPGFGKQDPALDAEEDRLYAEAVASATARMEAAEAREDRAEYLTAPCFHATPACARCVQRRRAELATGKP